MIYGHLSNSYLICITGFDTFAAFNKSNIVRQHEITCIDPEACTPENCRFVDDGCDQSYWKLIVKEGIQVGQYQNTRPGLTFSKDGVEILHVFHKSEFGEEEICTVHPDKVPQSLLELLRNRDLAQLVSETNSRLFRMVMMI